MASETFAAPAPARRGWGPEHFFAALVAGFGLLFAFVMPPCQTPDEPSHFLRAYHVSEGHLAPERMVGRYGGGEVPVSILVFPAPFANLPFHPENQARLGGFVRLWRLPLAPDVRQPVPFAGSTYYSFVPYVPQALGVAVARAAGGGPLVIFYAGRLANLALGVLLVFWAIRVTPIFKLVFGTVALIPMCVHQLASMNPDASTIGAGLLFSAFMLRLIVGPRRAATRGEIAALFGLAVWLTLCKFPYASLCLLYLAVPVERFGSRRRYAGVGVALLLVVAGLAAGLTQLRKYTPDGLPLPASTASIKGQTHYIRTHPLDYAQVLLTTAAEHGQIYFDQLGKLGWLDTPVNPLAMHLFFTFLAVVALGDRSGGDVVPSLRLRLLGPVASLVCGTIILTSCYVCGCPVGAQSIVGPQGRYFLPFLVLLLLPLSNRLIGVRAEPGVLQTLAGAAGASVLLVALANAFRRYYLPPEEQMWLTPLALASSLLLFGTVAAWTAHRRRGPVAPDHVTATTVRVEDVGTERLRGLVLGPR